MAACEYSCLSFALAITCETARSSVAIPKLLRAKSHVVAGANVNLHVVAGANERRLYSPARWYGK